MVAYSVVGGGGGAASNGYTTIQDEGIALTQRNILNFIGDTVTAADDAGNTRTNVTITGYDTVAEEGTPLTKRRTINFIGSSVTAADDAGNARTNITITDAAGGDDVSVNSVAADDANFDNDAIAPPTTLQGFLQSDYYCNVNWQKDSSTPNNITAYIPKRFDLAYPNGMMLGNYFKGNSVSASDVINPFSTNYLGGGTKGDTFIAPTNMWLRGFNAMTEEAQVDGRTVSFRIYRETEGTDVALSIFANSAAGSHAGNQQSTLLQKGETWSVGVRQVGAVGASNVFHITWEAATENGTSLLGNGCDGPATVATRARASTAQAGGASEITLDAAASGVNDAYNGARIWLTGGTGSGQDNVILDYVGATKVATVETAWSTAPDVTTTFTISGTEYALPGTAAMFAATEEGYAEIKIPFACTLQDLFLRTLQTQGASGDLTLTIRKNGADTSCRIQVAASGGAGAYSDITNTVSLVAGDRISFCLDNQHTSVSTQLAGISCCLLQTSLASDFSDFRQILVSGAQDETITVGQEYRYDGFNAFGIFNTSGLDVRRHQAIMTRNGVLRNMYVRGGHPVSDLGPTNVTIYKNNVATALVVTIPQTTNPVQWVTPNTSDTVSVVAGDLIHIHVTDGGGVGANNVSQVSLEFALS